MELSFCESPKPDKTHKFVGIHELPSSGKRNPKTVDDIFTGGMFMGPTFYKNDTDSTIQRNPQQIEEAFDFLKADLPENKKKSAPFQNQSLRLVEKIDSTPLTYQNPSFWGELSIRSGKYTDKGGDSSAGLTTTGRYERRPNGQNILVPSGIDNDAPLSDNSNIFKL